MAAALVPFGSVGLDPAPDTTWVHGPTSFRQKFGNVLIGKGISEVPGDAQNNHLAWEMTASNGLDRVIGMDLYTN